ncbi:hypothetical protein PVAP13_7NG086178 [Panicum virgatum]|uniref:Uncharacterized protein n=1 Tax=Panicum virgatum TaxID=38727 RepID=A0A8T0PW22_PANVG|nr:hypothetical protein PVAP13_7NG086178 [Panicum virgatum]
MENHFRGGPGRHPPLQIVLYKYLPRRELETFSDRASGTPSGCRNFSCLSPVAAPPARPAATRPRRRRSHRGRTSLPAPWSLPAAAPSSTGSAFRAAAPSPTGGVSAAAPSSTGGPLFFLALEVLRPSPNSAEPYPRRIEACAAEATCAPAPERRPLVDLCSPAALRQIDPAVSFLVTSSSSPTHSPWVLALLPPGSSRSCSPPPPPPATSRPCTGLRGTAAAPLPPCLPHLLASLPCTGRTLPPSCLDVAMAMPMVCGSWGWAGPHTY